MKPALARGLPEEQPYRQGHFFRIDSTVIGKTKIGVFQKFRE